MTKFNPLNKEELTYGECLDPAMHITDQADADQYKKDYIAFIQKHLDKEEPRTDDMTAEQIANTNLGYYAGYGYDRERVERLFKCAHPILGSIAENGESTAIQAFTAGFKIGKKIRESKVEDIDTML